MVLTFKLYYLFNVLKYYIYGEIGRRIRFRIYKLRVQISLDEVVALMEKALDFESNK